MKIQAKLGAFLLLLLPFLTGFASKTEAPAAIVVLQVFVLDENGNVQENATVKLFETEAALQSKKGEIASEKTNKRGKVVFKGLDEKKYYILAQKGKKDNLGGAYQTEGKLDKNRVNKINIIVSAGPSLPGY